MDSLFSDKELTLSWHDHIEWASAQVPPTPLYLGGTVERERERGEGEMDGWIDGWGWMDGWTDGRMDGWMDR